MMQEGIVGQQMPDPVTDYLGTRDSSSKEEDTYVKETSEAEFGNREPDPFCANCLQKNKPSGHLGCPGVPGCPGGDLQGDTVHSYVTMIQKPQLA